MFKYLLLPEGSFLNQPHCFDAGEITGVRQIIKKEVLPWCQEQFGKEVERWSYRHNGLVWFRDEIDAFKFKMRWG